MSVSNYMNKKKNFPDLEVDNILLIFFCLYLNVCGGGTIVFVIFPLENCGFFFVNECSRKLILEVRIR